MRQLGAPSGAHPNPLGGPRVALAIVSTILCSSILASRTATAAEPEPGPQESVSAEAPSTTGEKPFTPESAPGDTAAVAATEKSVADNAAAESPDQPKEATKVEPEKSTTDEDDLTAESVNKPPTQKQEAQAATTPTPQVVPPEDQDGWISWPFSDSSEQDPNAPPSRWISVGGFFGMVSRPSRETHIEYKVGPAWGAYLRAEVTSWLGVRLLYREERIPVTVSPGAFDYGEDSFPDDVTQPDLETLSLGVRFEPTWVVHPQFRLRGILGWAWLGLRAPLPESEAFEHTKTYRGAAQTDFSMGAGLAVDLIKNWLELGADLSHSLAASRTGDAYDKPQQVIVDGAIQHIAPLPRLQNSTDLLFSLGVIF